MDIGNFRIYRTATLLIAFCLLTVTAAFATDEQVRPHAGMLRYPDVSATQIVFMYANDLWVVSREGGVASPLASPPGEELFPRFSPDGETIAFVGNYDGGRDIYTVPVQGGVPFRVTHHPASETLSGWTPSGELIFHANGYMGLARQSHLFTVPAEGGMPTKLPVPYGANGAINETGEWLAYTLHSRDFRTWKRYRGGMATDIWLFNLKDYSSKKITDWEGTDTYPMWRGDRVYFLSDKGEHHRLNIWMYDIKSGERKQITNFKEYDCKFPSIGPGPSGKGEIVFQLGRNLYLLDLDTELARAVEIIIPGARPNIRPQRVDAGSLISNWDLSSTGQRVLLEARGDIWTLPANEGARLNLTRTSGVAEREPAWSPDGRWIAYFSDETGEYELYIQQSNGRGEAQRLTTGGNSFRYNIVWSPDSKHIVFIDKDGSLYLYTIEDRQTRFIDRHLFPIGMPTMQPSWSHDSSWIAYAKPDEKWIDSIWMYNLETRKTHQVTSGMFNDSSPTFDRKGEFFYFVSERFFDSPIYDDAGWGLGRSFAYTDTQILIAVPLREEVEHPYRFTTDEETWDVEKESETEESETEDKENTEEESSEKKEDKDAKPLRIDLDGFENRAFPLPVANGSLRNLAVNHEGKLLYVRSSVGASGSSIKIFDLSDKDREEKSVIDNQGTYRMSADGKKILVRVSNAFAILDAAPNQSIDDRISSTNLMVEIEPREEWRQIFNEAWRIQRDYFYDPNLHGVDWEGVRVQYEAMLADCASREDVSFVISEMISELNASHAYYSGGDHESQPSLNVGMLGVDFTLHNDAYRIAKIYQGGEWDVDARSPFHRIPREKVDEGDYVLAVNGIPVDPNKDPWASFVGLANQTVVLTVSDKPKFDDDARDVPIQLLSSETSLRFRDWIETNRAYVEKRSGGKVGYIYVPDTGAQGQNELFRQFYGQMDQQALIIDERWNGGGQAPSRFIELLNRPRTNYWAIRDGISIPWPHLSHQGPKCMLINGLAGSGGDMFPALFRMAELGKLIGTRTWGGLIGISGNPRLIDGGYTSVPRFAYYDVDGTWGIEGHGVDPDIEVIDDPSLMAHGADPQLDAAIELMLEEIKSRSYSPPARPEHPDRSGLGIREEDK